MIYVDMIENSQGDLVDIDYYCSNVCFEEGTGTPAESNAWPGGSETDYDVFCANCDNLMWEGISSP